MAKVFVSYARDDRARVAMVVQRLQQLEHEVWLDQVLKGGQTWWEEILRQIRECEVFLAIVSPASIDSRACARERAYASALQRPILPVAIAELTYAMPRDLLQRQVIDYAVPTEDAAFRLVAALTGLPPAPALPDPLPEPPDVPLSYLAALLDSAESAATLGRDEQLQMINELESGLRAADKEERDGAWYVLGLLESRKDLLADTDRAIQRLRSNHRNGAGGGIDVENAGERLGELAAEASGRGGEPSAAKPPRPKRAEPAESPPTPIPPQRSTPTASPPVEAAGATPQATPGPRPTGAVGPTQWGVPSPDKPPGGVSRPANNMVWAILTTLLCCLPVGIVAIVYAAKVDGLWASGDHDAAVKAASQARLWSMIAAGLGIGFIGIYFVGVLASSPSGGY